MQPGLGGAEKEQGCKFQPQEQGNELPPWKCGCGPLSGGISAWKGGGKQWGGRSAYGGCRVKAAAQPAHGSMAGNGVPDGTRQRGPRRGKPRSKLKGSLLTSTLSHSSSIQVHKASSQENFLKKQSGDCGIQSSWEGKGLFPALEHRQIRAGECLPCTRSVCLLLPCLPSAAGVGLDTIPLGKGSWVQG